jgi:flagellar biosynthesis/type III secretory pathway chaperone
MQIHPLLDEVVQAVSSLRQLLEQQRLTELESALVSTQMAVTKLNAFPGGIAGLRAAIDALPETLREPALAKLQCAKQDYDVNAELIRLAMQRNAALQAYAAQSSAAATYSSEGGVSMVNTGSLLGKF